MWILEELLWAKPSEYTSSHNFPGKANVARASLDYLLLYVRIPLAKHDPRPWKTAGLILIMPIVEIYTC